jgi:hypothetical protein
MPMPMPMPMPVPIPVQTPVVFQGGKKYKKYKK